MKLKLIASNCRFYRLNSNIKPARQLKWPHFIMQKLMQWTGFCRNWNSAKPISSFICKACKLSIKRHYASGSIQSGAKSFNCKSGIEMPRYCCS